MCDAFKALKIPQGNASYATGRGHKTCRVVMYKVHNQIFGSTFYTIVSYTELHILSLCGISEGTEINYLTRGPCISYQNQQKVHNILKQHVVTSGFCTHICIVYNKMILWMKVQVISTLAGHVVEARYGVKDSGLNSVLKLYI